MSGKTISIKNRQKLLKTLKRNMYLAIKEKIAIFTNYSKVLNNGPLSLVYFLGNFVQKMGNILR